eukprot:2744274-Amphidinium_carterae.1
MAICVVLNVPSFKHLLTSHPSPPGIGANLGWRTRARRLAPQREQCYATQCATWQACIET